VKFRLVYNKKARVLNTNRVLLGAFIFMLIVIPFTKSAGVETDYTIDGNKVYINIADKGLLTQEPHTLTDLTNKPIVDFTSYFNTDKSLDFIFLFDTDKAKPTGAEYWTNYSHPNEEPVYGNVTYKKDCPGTYQTNYDYINSTWMWCNYTIVNETNTTEIYWGALFLLDYKVNASGIRIFWNETEVTGYIDKWYYDWKDISSTIQVLKILYFLNYTKAYFVTNVNFKPNEKKIIRPTIQVTPKLGESSGKYGIIIKFSDETFS